MKILILMKINIVYKVIYNAIEVLYKAWFFLVLFSTKKGSASRRTLIWYC